MIPRTGASLLRWRILEMANVIDGRQREVRNRRRVRANLRDNIDAMTALPETEFVKTFRLGKDAVRLLCAELSPLIREERRSDGLSCMQKLLIALSFYATGSYQTIVGQSAFLNVAQTTVSKVVREVTEALNHPSIFHKYIKWPQEQEDRNLIKAEFFRKFKIPGVMGCIDGTHVAILRPHEHEERFYNRKGYHSLNVMIICDSHLNIMCLDASSPGSSHDLSVWQSHPLCHHMNELSYNGEQVFLLGDSGYPLRRSMMTPILNTTEGTPEHYYYSLQVTARNSVERCIGVLKARFRCLLLARTLHYNPIMAGKIVNACGVLHNIANKIRATVTPLTPEEVDAENLRQIQEERVEVLQRHDPNHPRVNPDLQEARAMQQALVQRLWRERAV